MKSYDIFHCSKDGDWIVCVFDPRRELLLGVADCPDEKTARSVKAALVLREKDREKRELDRG